MGIENFRLPHFVPFQSPPCGDWKIFSCHKDGQLKKFGWPILWQLKFFGCQRCGVPQFFNHPSLWWPKLFGHYRKGASKAFRKIWHAPLSWQPKIFNHHWTVLVFRMVTEFFQSPSNTPPPSNGDWNISIAKRGVGVCYYFGKKPLFSLFGDQKNSIAIQWWGVSDSGGIFFWSPSTY